MNQNSYRIKLGLALQKQSKKSNQRMWRDLSEAILASRKNRPSVNISEISRNSKEGASVVIAGKVLGAGSINHKVTVAACSFSHGARSKITASGGKCIDMSEFMDSTPSLKDVKVLA
ncbi:MAG: 50S ribosomal protein L18e [Nitrososphaerales archaeon]